ncbi:MAG: protein translocase subunit SecF [Chloroflexi bacterium]|nr:protein translocase subunit SecF [Chloroflexota bacterium]MCY3697909.1 protein translocase subunit SecF [Chloroflexota bacterium]
MIDFVGRRRAYAVFSLLMIVPSLIGLALWQFEAGLDFAGGLETEVRFLGETDVSDVEEAVAGITDAEETPAGTELSVSEAEDGAIAVEGTLAEASLDDAFALADQVGQAVGASLPASVSLAVDVEETQIRTEFWFPGEVSQDDVRSALETIGLGGARIQATADSAFRMRVEQPADGDLERLRQRINEALRGEIGPIVVLQSSAVSGTLSVEIARDAGIALAVAAVAILIYISLAFRRLPNPVLYGSAAIVALLHDVTIVAGAFAIGGQVAGLEVNAMFVTALLAIIGYSVNDTIVVFDRIRENLLLDPREDFRRVVNAAITQSLGRSLNTSITVVLALLALLLIGGVTIRPFVVVLFIGTVAGTYSSIAVASQIVYLWQDGTLPRLLRMGGERRVVRRVERSA